MAEDDFRSLAQGATDRLALDAYLRTGVYPKFGEAQPVQRKFNPWHDPDNGRFTYGPSGAAGTATARTGQRGHKPTSPLVSRARYYKGKTANGVDIIRPTSGGYVNTSGQFVAEVFAPDPYRLTDPASAVAHYAGGSGEDRNYYLNSVDTSNVKVSDFPSVQSILDKNQPGRFDITGASIRNFDSGTPFAPKKISSANIVGRLAIEANGVLVISSKGRYIFNGYLGVSHEKYQFPASRHRTPLAEALTTFGRHLPGRAFDVHVIGTAAFNKAGFTNIRKGH